jgi:CarD family transcriptional regulator
VPGRNYTTKWSTAKLEPSGTFPALAAGRYTPPPKRRQPAWKPAGVVFVTASGSRGDPDRSGDVALSNPTLRKVVAEGYSEGVKLVVGDAVVYPAHGVGRVLARERRMVQGAMQEVVVLELAEGLSVTLPIDLARRQLRPLLSETDLGRVQKTLREDHTPSDDLWLKRRKNTQVKLAGGDPLGLAEVVRDGALRERRLIAKHNGSQLSAGERDLYRRARRLLSGEIGLAHGLDPVDADAWIEEQLATTA